MPEAPSVTLACAHHGQLAEALDHLEKVVMEGLRHGFFECSITCGIISGGKRQLVIRAGKAHKSRSPLTNCRTEAALRVTIPETGTSEMQIIRGPASSVGFRDRRPGARSGEEPPVRSSMKTSHAIDDNIKDDLIRRTREVWQPRLGRALSREDARQIAANVTGFFSVLAEWSRAELCEHADNTAGRDASEKGARPS